MMTCLRDTSGFSLLEISIAVTLSVLVGSYGIVQYGRMVEQAGVDLASSHLEAVWTAQRLYWVENAAYAESLDDLQDAGVLAPGKAPGSNRYDYDITDADADAFTAIATRKAGSSWDGTLEIGPDGDVIGYVQNSSGVMLLPPGS